MRLSLAQFSGLEPSNRTPFLADFITATSGFKVFGTHTHVSRPTIVWNNGWDSETPPHSGEPLSHQCGSIGIVAQTSPPDRADQAPSRPTAEVTDSTPWVAGSNPAGIANVFRGFCDFADMVPCRTVSQLYPPCFNGLQRVEAITCDMVATRPSLNGGKQMPDATTRPWERFSARE